MTAMIEARGLIKAFGPTPVLRDVSLTVEQGKVVSVIGPSGSGKSTFLRCLNALEDVDQGIVLIDGVPLGYELRGDALRPISERLLARQRSSLGFVAQQFNLFPHLSVLDNITVGLRLVRGTSYDEARRSALEHLDVVGLGDKASFKPGQLSGGQQQRAAIARAIAMSPKVLLFDEPTSALDPELVGEVLKVMKDLAAQGRTMVIVTHEMRFARDVSDEIVVFSGGHIVEQGTPAKIFGDPQHPQTRSLLAQYLAV